MKILRIALAPPRRAARFAAAAARSGLSLKPHGLAVAAAAAPLPSGFNRLTLRVEADTSISTFNPFLAYYNNGELNVLGSIYPTLTAPQRAGPAWSRTWPRPGSTSANQLTWTFKIRSGLKWSDRQRLTAADAVWTLNLIMKNQVAATANGSLVANFASVTAPDATTLVIITSVDASRRNMLYLKAS